MPRQLTLEQNKNTTVQRRNLENVPMIRLARESLALASVASFVWMVCTIAQLAR
jgi:hypothetical protein